jgi:hypothetical protein
MVDARVLHGKNDLFNSDTSLYMSEPFLSFRSNDVTVLLLKKGSWRLSCGIVRKSTFFVVC